jgi:hypothetical protein
LYSGKRRSLAMLLIFLGRASKAAIAIHPCSVMTVDLFPGFGDIAKSLLLRSNIASRFEIREHKETCLPDLSGQKWRYFAKHLISERGFISSHLETIFKATLVVLSQQLLLLESG